MKGSVLIFADKHEAKMGSLVVDTVFLVDQVHEWKRAQPPQTLRAVLGSTYASADRRHLRFGAGPAPQHRGVYTYSARAIDEFGARGSFMPIDEFGHRVRIELSATSSGLRRHLIQRLRYRLPPIPLAELHLTEFLDHLWCRTACAVSRVREAGMDDAMTSDMLSACATRAKGTPPTRRCIPS